MQITFISNVKLVDELGQRFSANKVRRTADGAMYRMAQKANHELRQELIQRSPVQEGRSLMSREGNSAITIAGNSTRLGKRLKDSWKFMNVTKNSGGSLLRYTIHESNTSPKYVWLTEGTRAHDVHAVNRPSFANPRYRHAMQLFSARDTGGEFRYDVTVGGIVPKRFASQAVDSIMSKYPELFVNCIEQSMP